MTFTFTTSSAEQTRDAGQLLASLLQAGDLIVLAGDLGAGKTTFTQGVGAGLGVQGRVTSPTYIVARTHDAGAANLALTHVDAYRLEDDLDLETIDLEASMGDGVTLVEWGQGKVEHLQPSRLQVALAFSEDEDARSLTFTPTGPDWQKRIEQFAEMWGQQ